MFIGKSFGITALSWVGVKLGFAELPKGIRWRRLFGVAVLSGIGFTMSIYVTNLAFSAPSLLDPAKRGIFAGSIVSGLMGYYLLIFMYPSQSEENVKDRIETDNQVKS